MYICIHTSYRYIPYIYTIYIYILIHRYTYVHMTHLLLRWPTCSAFCRSPAGLARVWAGCSPRFWATYLEASCLPAATYVCVYIHAYIYIYLHPYIYMYIYIHISMFVSISIYLRLHIYIRVSISISLSPFPSLSVSISILRATLQGFWVVPG